MSYLDALLRAQARQRDVARAAQRNAKRKLFEIDDDLDALADFDESEVLQLREQSACARMLD
jgi:hypothetical protein